MVSQENIKYSLKNLWQRKSRSFLTLLSIFIGITTIFIFVSFGWGLYNYVEDLATGSSADKLYLSGKGAGAPGTSDIKFTEEELDENKKEIKAHEEPEHAGYQQKVKRIKFLHPGVKLPHGEHASKKHYAAEKQHGKIKSVSGVEVGYAQGLYPGVFFDKLNSPNAFIIGQKQICGQDQGDTGKDGTHPFNLLAALFRKKKNHEKPDHTA